MTSAFHNQRRDDRQGQRDAQPHRGSQTGSRLDLHASSHLLHIGAHDVHPHAAPGDIRYFLRGRKSCNENHLQGLSLCRRRGLLRRHQSTFDRLGQHPLGRDSGAIVDHLDHDRAVMVERAQTHYSLGRLTLQHTCLRRLDSVVDRVPHGVGQRAADRLQQGLVQPRFLSLEFNPHIPSAGGGEIAHHPGKLSKQMTQRLHPRLPYRLAKLRRYVAQPEREIGEGMRPGRALQNLIARQHQLTHQVHHPVQHVDIDAQCPVLARQIIRTIRVYSISALKRGVLVWKRFSVRGFQPRQQCEQLAVVIGGPHSLGSGDLNQAQNLSQSVPQIQQPADQLRGHRDFSIAQRHQQALAGVRQCLQTVESQETRSPLDGMHRTEDLRHQFTVARPLLELGHAELHPLQPLLALREEFLRQLIHYSLIGPPPPNHESRPPNLVAG